MISERCFFSRNRLLFHGILLGMNIQIFGHPKCQNTKKAERWFKERRIPFQSINLIEKEMSPREFDCVALAVGGESNMINKDAKDYASIAYLSEEDIADKLMENQLLIKTPVVRNGRQATCGFSPDVWKSWE